MSVVVAVHPSGSNLHANLLLNRFPNSLQFVTPLMNEELQKPDRTRPAHLPNIERFNQPVILFVTACSKEKKPILADADVHRALLKAWSRATQYRVGGYVVMPDHVHLFCSPAVHDPEPVRDWVAYWKRLVSRDLKERMPIWQRDCWDTQLRHVHHYDEKWEYVVRNPMRRGLVAQPEDWPYQGVLNELRW